MSDRRPSLTTVRAAWCRAHPFWATTDVEEREAEFDRMIAEVERAAAEKAWDKGLAAAMEAEIKDAGYGNTQYPANPYRRNEGENNGNS
ncbi:hypothetical protein ACF07D_07520 [Leucobacter sp. NPDC015123]|uniref:hypothetical protein n=1 Tax=Leucobacter sp. NPDC015123 TaxID=3364129 RepID=UPI0036F48177